MTTEPQKPSFMSRLADSVSKRSNWAAAIIAAIGALYTQVGRLEDQVTRPLLVISDTETRVRKPLSTPVSGIGSPAATEVQHKLERYELRNPGPGTLRNVVLEVFIQAECDAEKGTLLDSGMEIETGGGFRTEYVRESKTRSQIKLTPTAGASTDLPSGRALWVKIIGPKDKWALERIQIRAGDGATYGVDDPESKSSHVFIVILRFIPVMVLFLGAGAFYFMFTRLESQLRSDLAREKDQAKNAESIENIEAFIETDVGKAVENLQAAAASESIPARKTKRK